MAITRGKMACKCPEQQIIKQELLLQTCTRINQMAVINNKFGKFFGPSFTYTGYALMAAGVFAFSYSRGLTSLLLFFPGMFIAFTYTGTIIDTENLKVKPYTSYLGIIQAGKWLYINRFSRFSIEKSKMNYTFYSRGSVRFDMNISNINLLLLNHEGTEKVVLKKFNSFEDARKEMDELSLIFFPEEKDRLII
jgi:hypothetical protein